MGEINIQLPSSFARQPAPCVGDDLGNGWWVISKVALLGQNGWGSLEGGDGSTVRVDDKRQLVEGKLVVVVEGEDERQRVSVHRTRHS